MNKQNVIDFFDRCAPWWDADMVRHEDVISEILDNGGIREGIDVLDEHALADLFAPWFDVNVMISDDRMYQVSGTRRDEMLSAHAPTGNSD